MQSELKELINNGILICGKIVEEDGIIRFERINPSEIESISQEQLGFATLSMGRAIFTVDKNGRIHNYKGVDSKLQTSEIGLVDLINAKSIEYSSKPDNYKISAVVFNDKKPEIRINGTSPLEDIEIEADINAKLKQIGVKVPEIRYVREIPQEYSIKYGLPIKINGKLQDFISDYSIEDDRRKDRLSKVYGDNYSQELEENQRPESMKEYLQRIGFLALPEVKQKVESLGYTIDDFVKAVDSSYQRGQRYGQAERIMDSPFRISDLEIYLYKKDKDKLKQIMEFSESHNSNFEEKLAEIFGRNIAIMMNNGWECENLSHRQDYALSGEFCDDSYFNVFERKQEINEECKYEPYKADALWGDIKEKYFGQVMHIASCIKVIQDSMEMIGKNKKQINRVLNKYIDGFTDNLNLEKIIELFGIDRENIQSVFLNKFNENNFWTKKLAGQKRKEGIVIDENIYNSHHKNEDFYEDISKRIVKKIRTKHIKKEGFLSKVIGKVKGMLNKKSIKLLNEGIQVTKKEISEEEKNRQFIENINNTYTSETRIKEKNNNYKEDNKKREERDIGEEL